MTAKQRRIDALLAEYGESHQNATNKLIHWVCVPLIAWTVTALLWSIPTPLGFRLVPYWNWCTLVLALAVLYYVVLSPMLALGMLLFAVLCVWGNQALATAGLAWPLWQIALAVFVIAWIGQFIGHKIEGKKPSFFKDLQFLLIGPAWLLHFIYNRFKVPY
ncbi:DUF962 domain-containing protein [Polycladidibacter hongkongensis]|uniref:Mpo1 family 2-hydroxy fatty acid dioxygenase n=1 Tax=Polycladidibacter hongkongensis TaxID=1647556 RepID=UPI00082EB57A|nr:Mpo1-like protein [Pseudovibrio hongkongensis]